MVKTILYFGFIASEDVLADAFSQEPAPQVSAAKFQKSLIAGFVSHDISMAAVSALPIASYPRSRIFHQPGRSFSIFNGAVAGTLLGGLNLPVIKLVTRFVKAAFHGVRAPAGRPDVIVVYSLHTPFLLAAALAKKRWNAPAVVVIPDLPMHMHGKPPTGLHGLLKKMDDALLNRLVRSFDLAVPFAKAISDDWLPAGMPYEVVEGLVATPDIPVERTTSVPAATGGLPRLMYTGSFTQVARFATLFAEAKDISAELIFVGDGADAEELKRLSAADARIKVIPFLPEGELAAMIATADFLINPRDARWEGGRYSFPSKLFDYVTRGKPVISTRLPGIDDAYFDHFLPLDDTDASTVSASLKTILDLDAPTLMDRVRETGKFCAARNSPHGTVARILEKLPK
ncbi:glycosyltransferase [Neorhizobium sp. NPDC001467]|uniref:glycosyltransferase n=1 Tax=Neorhizobium sp. NPDC001467 TaxID=3390595 RepID=UPI003CFCD3BF